jgi:glycerophosphoryl diester phosphodiesterase
MHLRNGEEVEQPVRRRSRLTTVLGALAVGLVVLSGCGDDDGTTAEPPPPEPDATPTTAPTTAATTPAEPGGPIVIAHRGASAYAPEHTFAAYDLALEQGADYLEQDLQMTADGVLVVLHDDTLDRTARGPAESCTGTVPTKTLAQLRECEVGSWFNEAYPDLADPAFDELPIPTMEEIIERYGTGTRYYIEIKAPDASPGMEEALLAVLDDAGLTSEAAIDSRQVLIQSFSPASLERLHALGPELPLVQLIPRTDSPIGDDTLDGIAEYAMGIGPSFANVDGALVGSAHARCLVVHPYTVDDPDMMAALLDAGVDGIFTNAPDVLLDQLAGRPTSALDC